jgi:2-dehydro-3-deoxyglucarate aldolase/4-hydroxy-2-oxoheptanedioate aldolase
VLPGITETPMNHWWTQDPAMREQVLAPVPLGRAAHAEEIAAVDGIDILWIGHFDLTASLGIPGAFESPRYREAVDRILAAGAAAGKPVGMVCGSPEDGAALVERGFRILAYSFDIVLYEDAVKAGLDALRGLLGSTPA